MLHKLKSTPIYHEKLEYEFSRFEKEFLFSFDSEYKKSNDNYFSKDTHILNASSLSNLKRHLEKQLLDFKNNILGIEQELYITESWIAKTLPSGHHAIHNHPNSMFSGVIYLQAPVDSSILFHYENDLFKWFNFHFTYNKLTEFNSNNTKVVVEENDLIIFPSWLDHSVEINNSNTERVVLGFNTFIKGNFGNPEYPTRLVLVGDKDGN